MPTDEPTTTDANAAESPAEDHAGGEVAEGMTAPTPAAPEAITASTIEVAASDGPSRVDASSDPAVDAPTADESEEMDGEAETSAGDEGNASPADALATGTDGVAAPHKRKRRRRRKKKATPDGAAAGPGIPGETSVEAGGDPAAQAGEHAEGDGEAASEVAPSEEASAQGDGEPSKHAEPSGQERKRERRPRPPQREKPPFAVGEEVLSRVTKVMEHAIMLDVSGKALGIIDKDEVPESQWPKEDEKIIAKVSNDGARGGLLVLTHDLNRWQTSRLAVENAFTHQQPINGLITGVIKGGVEVDVSGLRGFAPASHVDLRLGADLHYLIGQKYPFEVVQYAKRGREFVLSRRAILEAEAQAARQEKLKAIEPGTIVKGVVRSITAFGAFIDVGGVDGLVHGTEASHTGAPLREVFKIGQEVDVKILSVDDHGKVWLSKKATEVDPWVAAGERYPRGSKHKGKVVRLQPFGAFIELEAGIDGLLHVSDLGGQKRIAHPSDILKVGEEIEVVIATSDPVHHKLGLQPAPVEGEEPPPPAEPLPPPPPRLALHQNVKCVVEAQELTGLVVRIVGQTGRSSKGYIPAAATGTAKGADLRKLFPVGKEVDAKIIEIDPRRGSLRLSIKALTQDEERQSFKRYQNEVKVASKFGTFGDLLREKGITK